MDIKKELFIGGLVSLGFLIMVIGYGLKYKAQTEIQLSTTATPSTSVSDTEVTKTGGNTASTSNGAITAVEIAKHNKTNDCWIVINNKVLSVSSYLNLHPGGPGTIVPYCGKDATEAFNSIQGGKGHSQKARNMLVNFVVETLGQSISPTEKANLTMAPTATKQTIEDNELEENEDD